MEKLSHRVKMHIKLALKAQNNEIKKMKLNALCYWLLMNEVQREENYG